MIQKSMSPPDLERNLPPLKIKTLTKIWYLKTTFSLMEQKFKREKI